MLKRFDFLENVLVASSRDMAARNSMKRRGYRIDTRIGVRPPTPTREELSQFYANKGLNVILGFPYCNGGPRLNPHQYVGVYIRRNNESIS